MTLALAATTAWTETTDLGAIDVVDAAIPELVTSHFDLRFLAASSKRGGGKKIYVIKLGYVQSKIPHRQPSFP